MPDESQATDYPLSHNVDSETAPNIKSISDTNLEPNLEIDSDPFNSNIDVLQARIAVAEARQSAGQDANDSIKVLKARQALVEAKTALDHAEHTHSDNNSTHQIYGRVKATQRLTAARIPQPKQNEKPLANVLQFSSSVCAVVGGVLLSSNTSVSKYGFILLALSSSQLFFSSMILKEKGLMIYGASVFLLVDCLGIFRWLLQTSV